MSKNSNEKLKKHTLLLFQNDYKRLQEHYPEIGAAVIIRRIVRAHLEKLDPPIEVQQIKGISV